MYVLKPNFRRRGFRLLKGRRILFKTTDYKEQLYRSSAEIHGDNYLIKQDQDRFNIYKNGAKIGLLDLYRKPYSVITLQRTDGSKDFFKLESTHMSHYTLYTIEGNPILVFNQSWSKMFFINEFKIKVVSEIYPHDILQELIFYVGEAIYLKTWDNASEELTEETKYSFKMFMKDFIRGEFDTN